MIAIAEDIITHNMQAVFNTLDSGILVETADRTISFVNNKFLNIFGIPGKPEDMKGYNCLGAAQVAKAFFKNPDEFIEDVTEIPIAATERVDVIESTDGRHFKRKYHPLLKDGELTGHVWYYEQVTSLMHKELDLINQRNFYHTMLNELPADIAIFSAEHKYLYLNKTAIKNDEIRNWLIGKDDYEYCRFREKDISIADKRRAYFNEAKRTGKSVSWIDENIKPDGTKDYVLRIFYPFFGDNNLLKFVIGYGINITEQKTHEIAANEEKERFKTLMETLNDGVFQISFEGDIMFYNNSFVKAMNLEDYTMPRRYESYIMKHVHPEDKKSLYTSFDKLRLKRKPQKGIFRIIDNKAEVIRHIDYCIWYRHTDKDGDIVAGRLSDITERIQKEQQMVTLIDREKELNNMKSNFIHITSHELRTPLSVIMSSAEILEMYENNPNTAVTIDKRKFTSGIVKEVNKITDILNELLIVGRIENNKIKYSPKHVNTVSYINSLLEEQFSPFSDGRSVNLKIDNDVSSIFIDSNLMRHAISNILSNAFKYSAGRPDPELHIVKKEDQIHISITDFGIGIPETELKNLFHSFYRASNVGNISGTGIGLMVVQHAVKTHNGQVIVNSAPGRGTTFTIIIPNIK